MNKEAFERGFFKAAISNGLDPITATRLCKKASALTGGILGGLGGATVGGLGGAVEGGLTGLPIGAVAGGVMEANKPKDQRHYLDAILRGGGMGGLIGGGVGGTLGAVTGGLGGSLGGAAAGKMNDQLNAAAQQMGNAKLH